MFDFPDNAVLQAIIRSHFENGKTVAAICHGVSGLLNVRLSNGTYLIEGKKNNRIQLVRGRAGRKEQGRAVRSGSVADSAGSRL